MARKTAQDAVLSRLEKKSQELTKARAKLRAMSAAEPAAAGGMLGALAEGIGSDATDFGASFFIGAQGRKHGPKREAMLTLGSAVGGKLFRAIMKPEAGSIADVVSDGLVHAGIGNLGHTMGEGWMDKKMAAAEQAGADAGNASSERSQLLSEGSLMNRLEDLMGRYGATRTHLADDAAYEPAPGINGHGNVN